ncbi:phage major tail tube protein [Brucella sp.]|uniref:phage major tail tube protein n=1 Tax=Brucella sp. TaxID=52132 RepID=UPI0028A6D28F|nr:phage major tail tube protein [Brucella sp.]
MSATITNLNAANLFIGDDDPTSSEFLSMKSVKLPKLTRNTKEHLGGGAAASLTIGLNSFKIDALTFSLEGVQPHLMKRFMANTRIKYTFRANLYDTQTQEDMPLIGVIEGKMTELDPGEYSPDQGVSTAYAVNEIVYYELTIKNEEKIYFDYFAGPAGVRFDGRAPLAPVAANIGIS